MQHKEVMNHYVLINNFNRFMYNKPIPADNLKKYKTKHNPKISILRNPRYGLKQDKYLGFLKMLIFGLCLVLYFRFMYNYTKHKDKHFCMYCLQCFTSAGTLGKHNKNCITVNGKQAVNMPKGEKVQFKYPLSFMQTLKQL